MSYRRQSKNLKNMSDGWNAWLSNHRKQLSEMGLPDIVIEDAERWLEFLAHGQYPKLVDPAEFRVSDLSNNQSVRLLFSLESELPHAVNAAAFYEGLRRNIFNPKNTSGPRRRAHRRFRSA